MDLMGLREKASSRLFGSTATAAIFAILVLLLSWWAPRGMPSHPTEYDRLTTFALNAPAAGDDHPPAPARQPSVDMPKVVVAHWASHDVQHGAAAAIDARPRIDAAGSGDPSALASESGDPADYLRILLDHLKRYRVAPQLAEGPREGIVTIGFSIDRQGHLLGVRVTHSSGSDALDAAAVAIIRRAAPMPGIPTRLPDPLDIVVPVPFVAA